MTDSSELMPQRQLMEPLAIAEGLDYSNGGSEHPPVPIGSSDGIELLHNSPGEQGLTTDLPLTVSEAQGVAKSGRVRKWIGRSLIGLAIGSGVLTIGSGKIDEAKEAVIEAAPWVGVGVGVSEAMFIGGAAMMVASAGEKVGNPLKLKGRLPEVVVKAGDSNVFRAGLVINTVGAFGDAAVIAAGTFSTMPVEAWGVVGLAMVDGVGTVAVRKWMVDKYRDAQEKLGDNHGVVETEIRRETVIREAKETDLDQLVELDLLMFDKAYGSNMPSRDETRVMLSRRLHNIQGGGGKMVVCEVDGEVSAFATYFRTNKPWDEFTTWEDTTNDGTLDGAVHPDGKYAYVVNMTVAPKGSEVRGMQKILANLFADVMKKDVEYGYFVSRVPQLTEWLNSRGVDYTTTSDAELDELAQEYVNVTTRSRRGKEEPYDYELRTYGRAGFERGKLVKGGFSDEESLSYGMTFRADIPLYGKPRLLRHVAANGLRLAAKSTRIASKLF